MALTAIGWTLAITGAVIGFDKNTHGCNLFDSGPPLSVYARPRARWPHAHWRRGGRPNRRPLTIVGPIVATVGARQRPEEVPSR
jgi:hypothetical protein